MAGNTKVLGAYVSPELEDAARSASPELAGLDGSSLVRAALFVLGYRKHTDATIRRAVKASEPAHPGHGASRHPRPPRAA